MTLLEKFIKIATSPLTYNEKNKAAFHKLGKQVLKQIAVDLGLKEGTFEIRSNKGGIAVSGEITLHGESLYIQFAQCYAGRHMDILYRSCKGMKDYTGEENFYTCFCHLVNDYNELIEWFKETGGL